MSKQTATDWLEKEFVKLEQTIGVSYKMYELLEQAKIIDEQNIKKAWINGYNCRANEDKIGGSGNEHNDYYNETFKNK